jgi:hypothetical protein
VVFLTRDLFDAIEFDAACSGDHRTAAEQMSDLAATGTQTDAFPRSEAFVRAGEQWLLADDPAAAATGFQSALAVEGEGEAGGGPALSDPRVPLARALFLMERPAEAEALIGQLEAEQPRDPRLCDLVAELLVERSDLPRALRWATAGVELCLGGPVGAGSGGSGSGGEDTSAAVAAAERLPVLPDGDRTELQLLLRLRFRVRNDLGLPEDSYDLLLDGLGGLRGLGGLGGLNHESAGTPDAG